MRTQEFEQFCKIVRDGITNGEVILTAELSDLDLAVQFAVGKLCEGKAKPVSLTQKMIADAIARYCGDEFEAMQS